MSSASDLFREVLALGDRVRGLGQRVNNLGARVDGSMSVQDLREEIATMKRESKLQYEREGPNANVSFFTGNIRRLEKELAAALSRKDAVEKKPEGGKYVKSDADVTCPRCRGTGEVTKDGRRGWVCPECRGTGKVPSESDIRANKGAPKTKYESRYDADKKPAEGGKYNASAVQKEIEKDKRIKPGEAKLIHGLLKGWRKDDANCDTKTDAGEITKASVQNMEKAKLMAALNSSWATPAEKKIIERELDDRANRGL